MISMDNGKGTKMMEKEEGQGPTYMGSVYL